MVVIRCRSSRLLVGMLLVFWSQWMSACHLSKGSSTSAKAREPDVSDFIAKSQTPREYMNNFSGFTDDDEWVRARLHDLRLQHSEPFDVPAVFPTLYSIVEVNGLSARPFDPAAPEEHWLSLWRVLPTTEKPFYYQESELGDDLYRSILLCLENYSGDPLPGMSRVGALMIYCGGEKNPEVLKYCHKVDLDDAYAGLVRLVCQ